MPTRRRPAPVQLELLNTSPPSLLDSTTLLPGFLIGLKTSVTGNVKYNKQVIEAEHRIRSGAAKATWQTERTIADPEEHKKASQTRMKVRGIITTVCAKSAFGLLCPANQLDKLELAVREGQSVAATFNRTARLSHVSVYVMKGEIAQDDVEAARAIKSEVRELLKSMSEGVKNLDPAVIRKAANQARNLGSMLSPEAAEKVKGAMAVARKAARKITKAAEGAAVEIDREALQSIARARTAFLDINDDETLITTVEAPETEAREVDSDEEAVPEADTPEETLREPSPKVRGAFTGRTRAQRPSEANPPRKGSRPPTRKAKAVKRKARA